MGHSRTCNLIGVAEVDENRENLFTAMTLLEVQQEIRKAAKNGEKITYWYAQTKTGLKILKLRRYDEVVKTGDLPQARGTIVCSVCDAQGCSVCNYSGITTKRNISGYADWQIEEMKKKYKKV